MEEKFEGGIVEITTTLEDFITGNILVNWLSLPIVDETKNREVWFVMLAVLLTDSACKSLKDELVVDNVVTLAIDKLLNRFSDRF